MEVRMECTKGTVVSGIDPVLAEIQQQLQAHPTEWLKALRANPAAFANLRRRKKKWSPSIRNGNCVAASRARSGCGCCVGC